MQLPEDTAQQIGAQLISRGETLAVAETAAGGLISAILLAVPGASAWFLGGAIAYSNAAKSTWLDLPPDAFAPHGVVSREGARLMARSVREQLGATWGLGEAGIAGPQTGRRSSKPAGLAYLAVVGPHAADGMVEEFQSGVDDRPANQRAFTTAALALLARALRA